MNRDRKTALFYAKEANDMKMIKLLGSYMPTKESKVKKPLNGQIRKPKLPVTTMPVLPWPYRIK